MLATVIYAGPDVFRAEGVGPDDWWFVWVHFWAWAAAQFAPFLYAVTLLLVLRAVDRTAEGDDL